MYENDLVLLGIDQVMQHRLCNILFTTQFLIPYDHAIRKMLHFRFNLQKYASSVGHLEYDGSHFEYFHVL